MACITASSSQRSSGITAAGFPVSLSFRVDVDQDLGVGKASLQGFLHGVETVMRLPNRPFGRHPDMELSEIMGSAGAGAQVVQAGKLRILFGGGEEPLAKVVGPFAVHQLVESVARCGPCAPQQPERDEHAEYRVRAPQPRELVERQSNDD